MKPKFALHLLLAGSALIFSTTAHAATLTWDANGATAGQTDGGGDWLATDQWWDGVGLANVNWTTGDDAVFGNAGVGGAVTLASPTTVNSLTLNSFTGTYTLGTAGQVITLNTGVTMNAGAGAATIISPLTLGAAQSWLNNSSSLLTVGTGAVDNGGFLLTVGGSGATTVSSAIGGLGGLTKQDAGLLTLSGINTYSGGTNINQGLVKFTATAAMTSGGGTIAVSSGAGLIVDVKGTGRFAETGTGAGTFAGILTGVGAGGNTITYTGDVTVGIDVNTALGATYAGIIANATGSTNTSIYKINGQNLTLTGANTYSGKTLLGSGGSVVVSSFGNIGDASSPLGTNSTIEFLTGGNLTFQGTTVQSSNKTLNIAQTNATLRADGTGVGAITLTANINPTSTTNKTLSLFGANTNANTVSGSISNGAGGVLSVSKGLAGTWILSGTNSYTGGTTISGGTLIFRNLASKATTGTHAFAAGTTLGLGVGTGEFTTSDVDGAFTGGVMTGNLSNVTVTATTHVGIDTTAANLTYTTNVGAVTKGLAKFGANILTLTGTTSAYSGATNVFGGTLSVASLAPAGSSSSIGAFATAGATGLLLSGGTTFSYTGSSTTTDRGFTHNAGGVSTFNVFGAGVALTVGATTIASTDNLNITGGAGSTLNIGPVTVTATQANFNASIPTNVGNLTFSSNNVIGNRGNLATSIVNFANMTGTGANTLFLAAPGNAITTTNFNGVIGGFTGNVSIGGENLSVLGANTYTGQTNIQSGSIRFNSIKNVNDGASAFGAPTSAANGTIGFGNGTNNLSLTYTGTEATTDRVLNLRGTTGTVTLFQSGTGLLKFTSNLTATGGGSKTLVLSGSTAGTGELGGAIIDNSITNTTSVSKTGTGTWALSGANTYTGTTSVSGGKLFVNGNQTAANGAVSVAATATLGGTGTLGGDTSIADNGKLEFNLSTAPGSHDKLELATSKALSFGANATLTITSSGGATTGLYTLVTAPGGVGALPAFTVNLPMGWTAAPPAISGNDLVLNITSTGGSAYDTWKAANAPGSNPNDDTDGDGVTNAVEFVLGGTSATKDLDKLPLVSIGVTDMTFTFKRAVASIDPKTALFIETSTDLATWNTAPSPYTVPDAAIAGPPVTVVEDSPAGFDTVTLTVPKAPDAKKFARLKAVITP